MDVDDNLETRRENTRPNVGLAFVWPIFCCTFIRSLTGCRQLESYLKPCDVWPFKQCWTKTISGNCLPYCIWTRSVEGALQLTCECLKIIRVCRSMNTMKTTSTAMENGYIQWSVSSFSSGWMMTKITYIILPVINTETDKPMSSISTHWSYYGHWAIQSRIWGKMGGPSPKPPQRPLRGPPDRYNYDVIHPMYRAVYLRSNVKCLSVCLSVCLCVCLWKNVEMWEICLIYYDKKGHV